MRIGMIAVPPRAMMALWQRRGIVGAVRGHGADVLVLRDLAKQVWQDGAVALPAGGEFYRANVRGGVTVRSNRSAAV